MKLEHRQPHRASTGRAGSRAPAAARRERWPALLVRALETGQFRFVLLDCDGQVLGANEAACDLLGRRESDLTGRALADFIHVDDRGWSEAEIELLLAGAIGSVRQELRLLGPDRSEVWTELSASPAGGVSGGPVRAIAMLRDVSDRRLRELELGRIADTDRLTGLYNRRWFTAELERHLARGDRYGRAGALLVLDLDRLKAINEAKGHHAGDNAIFVAATLLRARLRASDVVARIGDDEFAVLLPAAPPQQAAAVARSLVCGPPQRLEAPASAKLTFSIGIATITDEQTTLGRLFDRAYAALHEVKRSGGDGYAIDAESDLATTAA
jgi:diguanylate cyclase (GGDEF)-like protein/PAS domain S-box-containing protein